MDFTKHDARGAAEVAQFCHLRDPVTGDYIADESGPVGVMLLGATARSVQAQLKNDQRARMQATKGKELDARALEDIQADLVKSAARLTVGFLNVQRNGADATAADAEWFFDLNMFNAASLLSPDETVWQHQSFAQQALAFSNKVGFGMGNA